MIQKQHLYVFGVDPGAHSGFALFALPVPTGRGRVLCTGEASLSARPLAQHILAVERFLPGPEEIAGRYLAVEGQYVPHDGGRGQDHRAQAVSSLKTAASAGRWAEAAAAIGWQVLPPVQPEQWRQGVFGPTFRGKSTEVLKAWAMALALRLYGVQVTASHHHQAEAALLASFAAEALRELRQLEPRARLEPGAPR
jgi:hypothetical protein